MAASTSLSSDKGKQGLSWTELLKGWSYLLYEVFLQKFSARHLKNPLPLPPLNDITCIVTGSTSGIGLEIARQLAVSGAHVVMAVRNKAAANELILRWQNDQHESKQLSIEVMELNLLCLSSVVSFAKAWNSRKKPLNVLVNNAGIFSIGQPQMFSKDGYETHLQVNHLAPALLSLLLLPSLIKGAPSRIVNLNSTLHFIGFVDTEDMNFVSGKRKFMSSKAYSSSKVAEIMFSSMLQRYLPLEFEVSIICLSPGSVVTNVVRDLPKPVRIAYRILPFFLLSAQEGSRSALYAATDPHIPSYCKALKTNDWPVCAYISHACRPISASTVAHNMSTSEEVWEKTLDMVGLPSNALENLLKGEEVSCQYEAQ